MSYFQHLCHAWSMAAALFIHGLVPFVLKDYASNKINSAKKKDC
jgi:hypothetical protein